MFSFIITPLLAFLLGFALARANSCTVAAVHRLIVGKKYDWLRGLVVAAAASALTIYPLYLFFPDIFGNPQPLSIGLSVLLGERLSASAPSLTALACWEASRFWEGVISILPSCLLAF